MSAGERADADVSGEPLFWDNGEHGGRAIGRGCCVGPPAVDLDGEVKSPMVPPGWQERLRAGFQEDLRAALRVSKEEMLDQLEGWMSRQEYLLKQIAEVRPRTALPTWLPSTATAAEKELHRQMYHGSSEEWHSEAFSAKASAKSTPVAQAPPARQQHSRAAELASIRDSQQAAMLARGQSNSVIMEEASSATPDIGSQGSKESPGVVRPYSSNFNIEDQRKLQEARKASHNREVVSPQLRRGSRASEKMLNDGRWCVRRWVYRCVIHPAFDHLFIFFIAASAAVVGLQVESVASEWDADNATGPRISESLTAVQYTFNLLFLIEILLRIFAHGIDFWCGEGCGWNYIDFLIVSISCTETAVGLATDGRRSLGNLTVVRLVRFVRIIRVIRVIRLLKFCRALRILVHSIFDTLKQLMWAVVLLWVIMYSFGIIFTQAVVEATVEDDTLNKYYGSLPRSVFTLFMSISGGVNWEDVVTPLGDLSWILVFLFIVYIVFALFAVLNVMTAHFCQSALESAAKDENEVIETHLANTEQYTQKLKMLFDELDEEDAGEVTLAAFEKHMKDPRLKAYCETLDIEMPDAWTLFKLLDVNNTHAIDLEEFVQGCLQIRGYAKTVGVKEMMYELRWTNNQLSQFMEFVGYELSRLAECQDIVQSSVTRLLGAGIGRHPPSSGRHSGMTAAARPPEPRPRPPTKLRSGDSLASASASEKGSTAGEDASGEEAASGASFRPGREGKSNSPRLFL